jgi:hypothetical protein
MRGTGEKEFQVRSLIAKKILNENTDSPRVPRQNASGSQDSEGLGNRFPRYANLPQGMTPAREESAARRLRKPNTLSSIP